MIRIQQIKLPINHKEDDLNKKVASTLRLNENQIDKVVIHRRSLDARKKNNILYVYTVDVYTSYEKKICKNSKVFNKTYQMIKINPCKYEPKVTGTKQINNRPVIVGSGPSGLFCALLLAENGYAPIILERGKRVEDRNKDIDKFWTTGTLNEESNVQFGEGGAGTFSDGKLNTLIKDKQKRGRKVLEAFVEAGAPDEILYINKPHLGTDNLKKIVVNMRKKIIELGGTFRFEEKVTDIGIKDEKIVRLITGKDFLDTEIAVLAIGHSARDTTEMLNNYLHIKQKPFAIGVRIEHHQKMINECQYGEMVDNPKLRAADYKLTHKAKDGRPVYTFCMCPGGMVTASASEKGGLTTNGMSYYARNLENANSAVLVAVRPEDFPTSHPLAGVEFQRIWERKAFEAGGNNYKAPVQLFGDFEKNEVSTSYGDIYPTYRPGINFADLHSCLPKYVSQGLIEGINAFGNKMKGFNRKDAILTGIETRSSAPIRMVRNEEMESNIKGVYPCGEGAGYAGGIMSAAIDGLKVAESIMSEYKPIV